MATTIITKYGSGAPAASDVVRGELAVDTENKRLYTEDSGGSVVELGTNPAANVTFGDNVKAVFGAGSDLQIYHDGSNSRIREGGTGNLLLDADSLYLRSTSGDSYFQGLNGGAANVFYNGSVKLATTSTGIDVTGTVTADGLTVDTDTLVVDAANNRVGIGTTSPAFDLDISSSNSNQLQTTSSTTLSNFYQTTSSGTTVIQNTSGQMAIYTGGAERMRIDSSGNVGIGTASPVRLLSVYGAPSGVGGNGTGVLQALTSNENYNGSPTSAISFWTKYDSSGNTFPMAVVQGGKENTTDGNYAGYLSLQTTTGAGVSTERMRINSSGVVRIGAIGLQTDALFAARANGDNIEFGHVNNTGGFYGTIGARYNSGMPFIAFSADDSGNTSNQFTTRGTKGNVITNETDGSLSFLQVTTANAADQTPAERMRIDSSGNLLVNTTATASSNNDGFTVEPYSGGVVINVGHNGTAANGDEYVYFRRNGTGLGSITQVSSTGVAYNTTSDQRLKDNIVDAPSASDDIDAIQVRSFDWKADGSHQKYGMVAQELVTVAPEAVSQPEDPEEMMGVDYSKLVPMMLKEIQQLRARVAQLEGAN